MAISNRASGRSLAQMLVAIVVLCAFIISSALPSMAAGGQTGSIQGTIVDAATRAPLANVSVSAVSPSGKYAARTDARGFFSIIGATVDTYSISLSVAGYDAFTLTGVTVTGDQTVNLATQALTKTLTTIGRSTARSRSSAYQPSQTIDSVSVSGTRAVIAAGKQANTSENALALSVPGVQLTSGNRLTIRGGLSNEIGYQLDGIDFTEPFLNGNASNGVLAGASSVQIVEGAGDSTQGGIGGGVVNTTLKRGTHPAFGFLDLEAGGPNYDKQFNAEYGFATPDGRISDYVSYTGQRFAPYYGPSGSDSFSLQNFDGRSFSVENDFVNNFVYRFGNGNNQSLQVAYVNHDNRDYGDLSGIGGRVAQQFNPYNLDQLPSQAGDPLANANFYSSRYGLVPFAPGTNIPLQSPEQTVANASRYVKVEYTNSLNATTFLDFKTANVGQLQQTEGNYNFTSGSRLDQQGGQNTISTLELTHSFNDKNTTTFGLSLENRHPIWNDYDPFSAAFTLGGNYLNGSSGPSLADYALPANTSAPISATNPCPVTGSNACYLYQAAGYTGRLPIFGINYNGTDNQIYAAYLRDQFNPTSRLHFDLGLRFEGENVKQGANPFNTQPGALSNPDDVSIGVGPGNTPNFLRDNVMHPHFVEPHIAASFQVSNNDSIRAGFARSATFANAQSAGTPAYLAGLPASVLNLAPTPGTNLANDPSTWTCGSGQNPEHAASTSAKNYAAPGSFFQCPNYGQQLYWLLDQQHDAPDVGNDQPETFSNTDLTYQHLFKSGLTLKLTGYTKRGFNIPGFALISQVLNPQGVPITQVFGVNNVGINKTAGVEFGLQTAVKPYGLTAYLSATYTNVIDSVPPLVSGEDRLPLIPTASLALGDTYRAGYVSPFVLNIGAQYKLHDGFRINPVVSYDRGFPIGVGNLVASVDPLTGGFANLPQSNLNPSPISGYSLITGPFNATNYVDPVNPGTITNPNIAATRGTPETSNAGGILSRPRLTADVTFEFTKNRNTFGVQVANIFANPYSEPLPNPYYQPVASGLAGAQTGQTSAAIPGTDPYQFGGFRNIPTTIYSRSAYVEALGLDSKPLTYRVYYQLGL